MHPSFFATVTPDKPAYVMAGSGEVVTYRQLEDRSNQGAQLFRARGIATGDCIAIFLHNDARFLEIAWAAQRSGLYYVCIPTRMTEGEVVYMLRDSGAKLLIASADLMPVAAAAATAADIDTIPVSGGAGAAGDFVSLCSAYPATPIADEAPGQDMLYSSGTTGFPKGIKRARPTGDITEASAVTNLARTLYGEDEHSIYLSPAPLYHAAPLRFCMATHQLGGTDIIMEKFDPIHALELIERYRVTHAQWVPTHFIRLLKLPAAQRSRRDLSSLVCVFHAAAPCPADIKRQMLNWWGPIIHEYYSSTELNGLTAATPDEWLAHPGTVGRAILGTIRICDEEGNLLPARREGLVYFEGGNDFAYHNNAEATRAAANRHGWTTVGDIGWVDEDGFLYLTDRQSFMIISGGVNIYPQEIENLLICHPDVADVAVIGIPDIDLGERAVAIIQLADDNMAEEEAIDRLIRYARQHLAIYKVPREFLFRPTLNREPTGKLLKKKLRDELMSDRAAKHS